MIGKNEFKDNVFLIETISDERIRTRIEKSLRWFINKANMYKRLFLIFSITSIIIPIVSTIIINIPMCENDIKILSCSMSGATAACTSFISLLNLKKNWEIYRIQTEKIKRCLSRKLYDNLNDKEVLKYIEESMESTDES